MEDSLLQKQKPIKESKEDKGHKYNADMNNKIFICNAETERLIVISLISFSQGVSGLPDLAIQYIYKDHFHLSPATVTSLISLTYIPWFLKVFYGFISDSFPIMGYRRKPYLLLMTLMTILSLIGLAVIELNVYLFVGIIVVYQISSAFINTLAEALIIETSRKQAKKGKNQTAHNVFLFFFIRSFGYLLTSFCSGALIEIIKIQYIFIITTLFPLLILVAACFLKEKKINAPKIKYNTEEKLNKIYQKLNLNVIQKKKEQKKFTIKGQFSLLFKMLKNSNFRRTALYILIYSITPGYSTVMFYFYTNDLKFSPIQMGNIKMVFGFATIIGMIIFRVFLKDLKFKTVMISAVILSIFFNLNMIGLLKHINRIINIPDFVYVILSETLLNSTGEIMTMPLLILVCHVCPKNIEGTLYALFMAIMNLGYFIAAQGASLLIKFLHVTDINFDNLPICILITCGFLICTCLFTFIINDKKYENPFGDEQEGIIEKRVNSFSKFDINDENKDDIELPIDEDKPKRKLSSNSL